MWICNKVREFADNIKKQEQSKRFLNEFWALYHGVPKPEYLPEYRARQALLGQTVTVTPRNGTPRKAEALDIDEDCRLVVRFAGEHNLVPLRGEEVHLGKYL